MFSLVFHFEFVTAVALSERARLRQEYYANTGALKRAAENARGGRRVGCSIVETFSKERETARAGGRAAPRVPLQAAQPQVGPGEQESLFW